MNYFLVVYCRPITKKSRNKQVVLKMNMWQLFNALPRDVQWEVVSVFVGSYSVRKGKLIKKLVVGARHQMVQNIPRIQTCYIGAYKQDFNAKSFVVLPSGSQLMFCLDPVYGETGYTFRKRIERECSWMAPCYGRQYTALNNSVTLPTFAKRSYSSYEDTDKKKESRGVIQKPLCLRRPSIEEDTPLLQPSSPAGPPPPPPNPLTEATVGMALAAVLIVLPPPI